MKKTKAFSLSSEIFIKRIFGKMGNIPMLSHIDTRAVVKKIRKEGSMQASCLIPLIRMMIHLQLNG